MNQMQKNQDNEFLKGQIAQELDFYRIRENIAQLTLSEEGKENLKKREAVSDKNKIDYLKNLGREWFLLLSSQSNFKFSSWPPVKKLFKILGIEGSTLLQEESFALGLFCISSENARESIFSASLENNIPLLQNLVSSLPSLEKAKNEIFKVLDFSGNVKDLPELREIKNKIASIKKEIELSIKKYTSNSSLNNVLQSKVPVFKAERQLLAVRSDHKSSISGIIHEVSSSGQTVYLEPTELVQANNALVQEEYNLEAKIREIFKKLTANLKIYKNDFENAHKTLLLLDETLAAAKWQQNINGIFADDTQENQPCKIVKARHPLLQEKAVPVDINFLEGKRVLIITGPNTGGKTVTLKTVALFALLNQAGFPIPAAQETKLPIFNSIFADIGDEQSIEQSLSTFSAHMKTLAEIIKNADEKSLVLLDEFGSGTDPQEASAISMSVLDELIKKKSFVIVTTHLGILKNYGYTNPFCVNASVEFNNDTLSPTYKLLMGIPGESHAIDIALNSGIPKYIIQNAKNYIATEKTDISKLIKGLNQKYSELEELKLEQKNQEDILQKKILKLEQKEINLSQKELELKEIENKQSFEFLIKTRSELENLVRKLREGEITREKTLAVKNFIQEFQNSVNSQSEEIEKSKENLENQKNQFLLDQEKFSENGIRILKSKEHKGKSSKKTKSRLSNSQAIQNAQVSQIQQEAAKNQNLKNKIPKVQKLVFKSGMEVYAFSSRKEGVLLNLVKNEIWSVQFGSIKMNVPQSQLILKEPKTFSQKADYVLENSNDFSCDEKPKFELRLLGMRCEEAIKFLQKQLDLCAIHNFKNFSVIHGKGNGVLQQAVQDYLSNYPGVKNFHFAQAEDGGSGKTYVELF